MEQERLSYCGNSLKQAMITITLITMVPFHFFFFSLAIHYDSDSIALYINDNLQY